MKFEIRHYLGWSIGTGEISGNTPLDNFFNSVKYGLAKNRLKLLRIRHNQGNMVIYATDI